MKIPDLNPREYQLDLLRALGNGCKRAVIVWHRRCGKDLLCWNWMIRQAYFDRVGLYTYFFPTSNLGRRIIWDGIDGNGRPFLDYVPKSIIDGKPNSQHMRIRLNNGSIIQIIGTEKITNVGINPVGAIFSEYSLQDPKAWTLIRPIFRENNGWAIFNGTPRGKNHLYDMYNMAKNNNKWFCQRLTVDDTNVVSKEAIEEERAEGMSDDMIQQEFYCSFELGAEGSYYAKLLNKAELDGRITNVPYDEQTVVNTYWDIGHRDPSAVIFAQNCGQEIHIIDSYSAQGEGLHHYASMLQDKQQEFGYVYGDHFAPHDMAVTEFGTGQTRIQTARDLGIDMTVLPRTAIHEGIEMARGIWPRLWIDRERNIHLIKCLENYRKKFNETYNVYSDTPLHDWSSHMADAFRYLAMSQGFHSSGGRMTANDAVRLENKYRMRFR